MSDNMLREKIARSGEDEFLWWMRRGLIALALGVFIYGIVAKPILLVMTPLLMLVVAVAISRILRDKHSRSASPPA